MINGQIFVMVEVCGGSGLYVAVFDAPPRGYRQALVRVPEEVRGGSGGSITFLKKKKIDKEGEERERLLQTPTTPTHFFCKPCATMGWGELCALTKATQPPRTPHIQISARYD